MNDMVTAQGGVRVKNNNNNNNEELEKRKTKHYRTGVSDKM